MDLEGNVVFQSLLAIAMSGQVRTREEGRGESNPMQAVGMRQRLWSISSIIPYRIYRITLLLLVYSSSSSVVPSPLSHLLVPPSQFIAICRWLY